jgi:hypothetical protein
MYFLAFLDKVPSDLNALFAPLIPPPEGGGKVLFAQGSDDPSQVFLKVSWVRERLVTCTCILSLGNRKKSAGAKSDEQGNVQSSGSVWPPANPGPRPQCGLGHCPNGKIIGLFFLKILMNLTRVSTM